MSTTHMTDTLSLGREMIAALPDKPLLREFATQYIDAHSTKSILDLDQDDFESFIVERFSFFMSAMTKGGEMRIFSDKQHASGTGNKRVFEYVYPDAMFLLVTFSALFKEFGLRITKMLHPIMTVEQDAKGLVTDIKRPVVDSFLVSVTYIEFEDGEDDSVLDALEIKLSQHMLALQEAHSDKGQILSCLNDVQNTVRDYKGTLDEPVEEWVNLIDWLKDNFSFFGYGSLLVSKDGKSDRLTDALGILDGRYAATDTSHIGDVLVAHAWRIRRDGMPFVFDTIPVESPIQRNEHLMRLSLSLKNKDGALVEHNFVGLLKRSSLFVRNLDTPLIHLKMRSIFENKNMLPGSYDYNEVIRVFTAIPKFELFRTSYNDLLFMVESLLTIINPSEVYLYAKPNTGIARLLMLVVLPHHLFTRHNIQAIRKYLNKHIPHTLIESLEINGADHDRLHFYFEQPSDDANWVPNCETLQADIRELIKPWEERLKDAIMQEFTGVLGKRLYAHYSQVFPSHHRVRRSPAETVRDIMFLEKVAHENEAQFDLLPFDMKNSSLSGKASVLSIYSRAKLDLIHIMPILQNLGLYVYDQLTTRVGTTDIQYGYIHSFRVSALGGVKIDEKQVRATMTELLSEIFDGRTENDPLNGLALCAGMGYRAINIMMTYRNLLLQLSVPYTREKINQTLLNHFEHTQILFKYFESKFSPDSQFGSLEYRKDVLLPGIEKAFTDALRSVDEVADDAILRRFMELMTATLRTNFYIPKGAQETAISIKMDPRRAGHIPLPVPFREIYVHDVGMEGLHLRFGEIARGGLRWSDRPDDFRKEVLGLVKTQQTKNVVIVPVGSKGGFVVKKPLLTREDSATESVKQYQKFIGALLDITDNIDTDGQVCHPNYVTPYDGHDPYLVVAADKGTASFSDIANAVSEEYQFWLGDAFASGGSIGYNHKEEGITARGGWECVKLHFLEMGRDIKKETFTVAGIGDMSGDVFGNGMLLGKTILLQAAFNHMHVFVDPTPDPLKSWEERNRLFQLPRSSWRDYAADLISAGGGIFDRKAKEIHITPEMKTLFGIKDAVLTGEELVRAILKMKVDLLWFGGIGTYIKASSQTHAQVGDPANDNVRIDMSEVRALVIGEGANLGTTQPSRIEFARRGGRINTDAIDNSAGVNMSDYEVNIKILLTQLLNTGVLKSMEERNAVLEAATDEVSLLVLSNNRGQHRLLSLDELRSKKAFGLFTKMIQHYAGQGFLDAKTEQIPEIPELESWGKAGESLPRPIIAILQAYTKMSVYQNLMDSTVLDDPYLHAVYERYFPQSIREKAGETMPDHRLKRNIIGTVLTNRIVNQAGSAFFFHMTQLTGQPVDKIAHAYLVIDAALRGESFRAEVFNTPDASQHDKHLVLLAFEDVVAYLTQTLLQLPQVVFGFEWVDALADVVKTMVDSHVNKLSKVDLAKWKNKGFSREVAQQLVLLPEMDVALEAFFFSRQQGLSVTDALAWVDNLDAQFGYEWLGNAIESLPFMTLWDLSQIGILFQTMFQQKIQLIKYAQSLQAQNKSFQINTLKDALKKLNANGTELYFSTLDQLQVGHDLNLTNLTVTINRLNFIIGAV